MKKIALIGNPISHSESPRLFREVFPNNDMSYNLVERHTIEESITYLKENGYYGANVTAPFKESAMQFVTNPDPVSRVLNATNLILFKGSKIFSYNTDYLAVRRIIQELCTTNTKSSTSSNTAAIVVGCGGAGKAAALACIHEGLNTIITNRTLSKAEDFAKAISGLSDKTSAEMKAKQKLGKINALSIAETESLLKTAFCSESKTTLLIYTIPKTNDAFCNAFSKIVREAKATTCRLTVVEANYKDPCLNPQSGRTWLQYQAIESFRLFAGII